MGNELIRRRSMMKLPPGGGGGGGSIDDYVKNGLILWLDGIYNTSSGHSSSLNTWEDLSGNGYGYVLDSSNTWGDSYLQTNGKGGQRQQAFSRTDIDCIHAGATIELVIDSDNISTGYGCILPLNNYVGTVYRKNSDLCFSANSLAKKSLTMLSGIHYYNSSLWRDGVAQSNGNEFDSWGSASNFFFCYTGPGSYSFLGKVYALRIYNRLLTDDELLQNWNTDKARFGIS